MAIVTSKVLVGQKPTEEQVAEIRKAAKFPIVYTEDSPKLSKKELLEFKRVLTDRRVAEKSINIKLPTKDFQAYKSLGANYIKIMADVLSNALKQPSLLREASPTYKAGRK